MIPELGLLPGHTGFRGLTSPDAPYGAGTVTVGDAVVGGAGAGATVVGGTLVLVAPGPLSVTSGTVVVVVVGLGNVVPV